MSEFAAKYGPTALIAGGSEGVGAEYARQLAGKGLDLVLVARTAAKLEALQAELVAAFPERRVDIIAADLIDPKTPAMLAEALAEREIGLLIYNAGSNWKNGEFLDIPLEHAKALTALNVATPTALVHHFGSLMRDRGRGGIIIASSLAYLVGSPQIAVYSAAKAYSTTFAEALWYELRPHGVDVLSHAFGAVDTPFIERTFPEAYGRGANPAQVAARSLAALGSGPLLREEPGDAFAQHLASLPRAQAVETMAQAGKAYHD